MNDSPGSVRSTLAVFSICSSVWRAWKHSGVAGGYSTVKVISGFTENVTVDGFAPRVVELGVVEDQTVEDVILPLLRGHRQRGYSMHVRGSDGARRRAP